MTQSKPNARPSQGAAGFSLVELLVVLGIIGAMAAVALPNIGRYIRNYRIKGGSQQVAMEMNVARSKAISKNVNLGVVFAVVSDTEYQYAVEDDQRPQSAPTTPDWNSIALEDWPTLTANTLVAPMQAGARQALPVSLAFDDPTNCGVGAGTDTWGVRFTQLGSTCAFGAGTCGSAPPGAAIATNRVRVVNGTHFVCLRETSTNLRSTVSVTPGGRILVKP